MAAMFAGALAGGGGVREAAEAARAAPPAPRPPRAPDLLLDGLATRFTDGYGAGVSMLRQAMNAFRDPGLSADGLRWLWLAHIIAGNLWDEETLDTPTRHAQLARDAGALTTLPLALSSRIGAHVYVGELAAAVLLLEEAEAVSEATGIPLVPLGALHLAAWQGRETEGVELIDSTDHGVAAPRRGIRVDYYRVGKSGSVQQPRPV